MVNLKVPHWFQGLRDDLPVTVYYRNLPHWRQQGATYFVTFHLADALPEAKQEQLRSMRRDWERRFPHPRNEVTWMEYATRVFRRVEKWMDAGYGKCWFQSKEYAAELWRSILHFHNVRYEIGCFALMSNHCHLVMRPFDGFDLEEQIGAIKSVTSHFVCRKEALNEPLWQQESYDRIVRDDEHLYRVVQYIGANPRRAGIPAEKVQRWMNPDWQELGWGFRDQ